METEEADGGLVDPLILGSLTFFFNFLILFLAVLGLPCWMQAFSSCGEWGLLFVVVCRFLIAAAFLVTEQGSRAHRL